MADEKGGFRMVEQDEVVNNEPMPTSMNQAITVYVDGSEVFTCPLRDQGPENTIRFDRIGGYTFMDDISGKQHYFSPGCRFHVETEYIFDE